MGDEKTRNFKISIFNFDINVIKLILMSSPFAALKTVIKCKILQRLDEDAIFLVFTKKKGLVGNQHHKDKSSRLIFMKVMLCNLGQKSMRAPQWASP